MKKMQGQRTTLWWMADAATADNDLPGALSLAKLAADLTSGALINFTPAIVSGYTLNNTDDSSAVSDSGNGKQRGLYNYEASFQFFREANPAVNTTSLFETALTTFRTKGVQGYWVRRIGYPQTTALAVGHKLSVFKVLSYRPRTVDNDKGKPVLLEVKFGQQGFTKPATAIIA
jgi:hypothetical protein